MINKTDQGTPWCQYTAWNRKHHEFNYGTSLHAFVKQWEKTVKQVDLIAMTPDDTPTAD
jgi:hypothetical protein